MPNRSGIIALMGSGELTATMVEVHKELLSRYGKKAQAVFIDTPAGFQLNVDQLSQRAAHYFQTRVQHPLSIASLKSAEAAANETLEKCYRLLRQADFILIGPGSPTYALRQWGQSHVPQVLVDRINTGGCLVAASAAALTMGRFTLPVYEIYKAGHSPGWVEGLNILQPFGFDWAVMPHWNNAEGGNHDTRFCFMGEPRLHVLEAQLPETTGILGVDEHTALIIDLAQSEAVIKGIGGVTLRRQGRERVFSKQDRIPLSLLRAGAEWSDLEPIAAPHRKTAAAPIQADSVWDPLRPMAEKIQTLIERNQIEQAFDVLLALEWHIWTVQEALQERSAWGAAREILRDMLVLIGTRLAQLPADRQACLTPLVEPMLALRARLREQHQWMAADGLRDCLNEAGVVVMDTAQGQRWVLEK